MALFQPLSLLPRQKPNLSFRFNQNKQQNQQCILQFYQHSIILSKVHNDKKIPHIDKLYYFCPFNFDVTFEIILFNETALKEKTNKKQRPKPGIPIGIRLMMDKQIQQFYSSNIEALNKIQEFLQKYLNQKGFHQLCKPIKKLGKGNFGTVYLIKKLDDNKVMAAKGFLKYSAYSVQNGKDAVINQIEIMRKLNNKYLLQIYEVFQTQHSLYICIENLQGGSLGQQLRIYHKYKIPQIRYILKCILKGLQYLHSKQIMHRDLKPDNILFRKKNSLQCVIVDFGLATNCQVENYIFSRCGTPGFVAPQVINLYDNTKKYEPVCDIFSLGLIFYQMLSLKAVFSSRNQNELLRLNKKSEINFQIPQLNECDQKALDLLQKMLKINPEERIQAKDALCHQFFKNDQDSCKHTVEQVKGEDSDQQKKSFVDTNTSLTTTSVKEQKKELFLNLNDSVGKFVYKPINTNISKLNSPIRFTIEELDEPQESPLYPQNRKNYRKQSFQYNRIKPVQEFDIHNRLRHCENISKQSNDDQQIEFIIQKDQLLKVRKYNQLKIHNITDSTIKIRVIVNQNNVVIEKQVQNKLNFF